MKNIKYGAGEVLSLFRTLAALLRAARRLLLPLRSLESSPTGRGRPGKHLQVVFGRTAEGWLLSFKKPRSVRTCHPVWPKTSPPTSRGEGGIVRERKRKKIILGCWVTLS